MPGVGEVVGALLWAEEVEEFAGLSPGGLDVAGLCLAHEVLELGEDLLDRVEVGTVGRQEDQMRAPGADSGAGGIALVAAEVVHDHHVAGGEGGSQDLLDIDEESLAAD